FAAELSQIERQRGDLAAALGELMLLSEDPDRRVRAERELEDLIDDSSNRDAMIDRIEAMRKKHPKSAAMHDIAATAYLRFGRYPQAIDAVRAADGLANDQGEHLLDFGRTALGTNGGESVDLDRAKAGLEVLQMLPVKHPDSNLLPESTRLAAEGLVRV